MHDGLDAARLSVAQGGFKLGGDLLDLIE